MTSLTTGDGFYIDGTGKMRLGNVAGDNLYWNGSTLAVKGDIIAESLTLSANATITKGLTMGSSTEKGFIASYGMSSLTDTTGGYYIAGDGQFVFGQPGGANIKWTGSTLNIQSSFDVRSWYPPTEGIIYLRLTNNTTVTQAFYYRIDGGVWTSYGSIATKASLDKNISGLSYGREYFIEVRIGTDDTSIQGNYFSTSTLYIDDTPTNWSASGGTVDVDLETAVKSGTSETWIVTGTGTISSVLGTCTITIPYNIYYSNIQVSVKSSDSSSGMENMYAERVSDSQFKVTNDHIFGNNSLTFYFVIIGFRVFSS